MFRMVSNINDCIDLRSSANSLSNSFYFSLSHTRTFIYTMQCSVCRCPVAKRNFMKRHSHGIITSARYTIHDYINDQEREQQRAVDAPHKRQRQAGQLEEDLVRGTPLVPTAHTAVSNNGTNMGVAAAAAAATIMASRMSDMTRFFYPIHPDRLQVPAQERLLWQQSPQEQQQQQQQQQRQQQRQQQQEESEVRHQDQNGSQYGWNGRV